MREHLEALDFLVEQVPELGSIDLDAAPPSLTIFDLEGAPEATLRGCALLRRNAGTAWRPRLALVGGAPEAALDQLPPGAVSDLLRLPLCERELGLRVSALMRSQRQLRDLSDQAEDLYSLIDVTRRFASTLDVGALLFELVTRLAEAIHVARCSLVLTNADQETGVVLAASDDQTVHDLEIDLAAYPEILETLRTKAPVVIERVNEHPLLQSVRDALEAKGIGAAALFPLVFEGSVIGVLFLRTGLEHNTFGRRALHFARIVADATAVGLRNARLYEHLRDESKRATVRRIQAEQRAAHLRHYAGLFEQLRDGVLFVDDQARVIDANPAAQRTLALQHTSPGTPLSDLAFDSDSRRQIEMLTASLLRGMSAGPLLTQVSGEERGRPVSLTVQGAPLDDGGAVVIFREESGRLEADRALIRHQEYLQRIVDASADAIVAADQEGRVTLWSPAAERITGWRREEVVGRLNISSLYPKGQAREAMRLLRGGSHGGQGVIDSWTTEIVTRDLARVPVALSAAILYERGEEIGTMGVFSDQRARLRVQTSLDQARERLERGDRQALLAELAGATAHELNQPLTCILSYADLLLAQLEEGSSAYRPATIIAREAERMADIVQKIRRITRHETIGYPGQGQIVDLDASSAAEAPEREPAPAGAPSAGKIRRP